MLINLGRYMRPARTGVARPPEDPVPAMPSSILFEIDATQTDSYPGTGTVVYDLEGDSTFNFNLVGTPGDEPVFVGSAGSPSAYFDFVGSTSGLIQDGSAGSQPNWIEDFHQANNGQTRSVWMAFRLDSPDNNLLGNQSNLALHGFDMDYDATNHEIRIFIANGASGVAFPVVKQELVAGTDYLMGLQFSSNGSTTTAKLYVNSFVPYVVTAAFSGTTDADSKMTFGNDDSIGSSGAARLYWAAGFEGALSADDVKQIAAILEYRHSRAYIDLDLYAEEDPLEAVSGIGLCGHVTPALASGWGVSAASGANHELLNVVASPASGTQSASDFYIGDPSATTAYGEIPRLTGPIGKRGTGLNFKDEDERIIQKTAAGLLVKAHRTDQAGFWGALLFKTASSPTGSEFLLANTTTTHGIQYQYDANEEVDFTQFGGTTFARAQDIVGPLAGDTVYLLIGTWDGTQTSNNVEFWLYNSTGLVENGLQSLTFNTSTTDATGVMNLLSSPAGNPVDAGTIFYDFAHGNVRLDDTMAANIAAALATLHGVDLSA